MSGDRGKENLPHSVWSGSFTVCGIELKCHTLSDGTRIIEKESLRAFFENIGDNTSALQSDPDVAAFRRWQSGGRP